MLTLEDIIKNQNPGVRQNPYKYKILKIMDIFDSRSDEITVRKLRKGQIYINIEDIPAESKSESFLIVLRNHFMVKLTPS